MFYRIIEQCYQSGLALRRIIIIGLKGVHLLTTTLFKVIKKFY